MAAALLQACTASSSNRDDGEIASPIIYGSDDRTEHFDVASPGARSRLSASMVAFIPKAWIDASAGKAILAAPSWGDLDGLCPGERFADQPAAAFCTGVLVDWDLVLTAGHCVRLLALEDVAVVFGYYYTAPGVLALDELVDPIAIVAEALDPADSEPRLDYAWLRLKRAVAPPKQPAPLYVRPPPLALADPVVSISAGGGVPLKLDAGGRIRDLREQVLDYFVADTDTTKGSSGGGAFDQTLALLGILARGQMDFVDTPGSCRVIARQVDGAQAEEQFTYAHRAVERLCQKNAQASSICRPECENPCQARPPPVLVAGGGCTLTAGPATASGSIPAATLVLLARGAVILRRRRRGRR